MKNSETSTAESTQILDNIILPSAVNDELVITLNEMKAILSNDAEGFTELVSKCLLVGKDLEKSVYWSHINNFIIDKYSGVLLNEDHRELLGLSGSLVRQLCFSTGTISKNIDDIPYNKWGDVRDELDHIVLEYCGTNAEQINLIGGINQYHE